MNAAEINVKIWLGRGKAALRIGLPCGLFRPLTANEPLGNQVTTINAAFNAANPTYTKPQSYGKPVWYVDLDGTQTEPGDYLVRVSDSLTWFIADQQQLLPIIAVACNGSVRVSRMAPVIAYGPLGYSGVVNPPNIVGADTFDSTNTTLDASTPMDASLWPASILQGSGANPSVGLPADVKSAGWKIMLPVSIATDLWSADFVTDNLGRRFAIQSAELTDLGWRLVADEVHP